MKKFTPLFILLSSITLMGSTCEPIPDTPTCNCRTTQSTCADTQTCVMGGCKGGTVSSMNGLCTDGIDGGGTDQPGEVLTP